MATRTTGSASRDRKTRASTRRKAGTGPAAPATDPFSPSLLSASGQPPEVGTIVYVHGFGNKPPASVLKCQWDTALFGFPMGERTRLAYWVDRERYPVPEAGDCHTPESIERAASPYAMRSLDAQREPAFDPSLGAAGRRAFASIRSRMLATAAEEERGGVGKRVLPFPRGMRRFFTRLLTDIFLDDVNDFLFQPHKRQRMEDSLLERIRPGGGPFIVIAHSQGSLVAYEVLRKLTRAQCEVRLFVTVGSPLGMQEVQDVMRKWIPSGRLRVPECVDAWLNVAERLDPVAIDNDISNDFAASRRGVAVENVSGAMLNPEWRSNPHSGTGYLRIDRVRDAVRGAAGSAFGSLVARSVMVRDLVNDLEDGDPDARHPALIQLVTQDDKPQPLDEARTRLTAAITALTGRSGASADEVDMQVMRRFVSARLTRSEIETLRTHFDALRIDKVWRNALKRKLVHQSADTVQARPGILGYGATGYNIAWAVLDTGIQGNHPHFSRHGNVVEQWDCTARGDPVRHAPDAKRFGALDGDGHGTHVAGIVAGEHRLALARGGEPVTLAGMAPQARLYGFKVLKDNGQGEDAYIIKALDKIAELNERAGRLLIHGVNLSLGGGFDPSAYGCGHTPICQELRRLWNQGVLVVIAAGNEGYAILASEDGDLPANMDLSIGDPANLDEAIAVGSIHKVKPHTYGVSYFSSRGPTADGRLKPDLVAPGERILSARHASPTAADRKTAQDLYVEMSGTSMAAPHVSGILAAFLSVRTEFIGYPDRVKKILLDNCTDLQRDPYIQGHGMPNLVKMLINT